MVAAEPGVIERLFSEGRASTAARERGAFDAIAGARRDTLVLFGAGGLGRRMLAALRCAGVEPLAFADNRSALWGTTVDGLGVMSPADAARRFAKEAAFVVTIWGALGHDRMSERERQLRLLGCECVTPFLPLAWKYPAGVLPHYGADLPHRLHDARAEVCAAYALWADDESRAEYARQIRWRLFGDFASLAPPAPHAIYFPQDICPLRPDETFVDCGAFDGDTARLFVREAGTFEKIIAFEPDAANFSRLEACLLGLGQARPGSVVAWNAATGARRERLRFVASGNAMSAVGDGETEVDSVALDDALADVRPTYIKMDIEGSEPEALTGARRIIADHEPVLAISCYHRQDHLWRIPLQIHAANPNYQFFLRPHDLEMWDLICYAVPPARRA